mgnify:CR=1 FL=1
MSDEPDSLVLRYLRRLEDKFDRQDQWIAEMMAEIHAIKLHHAGTTQTDLAQDEAITNLRSRVDRIERRLDLNEEAP